MKRILFHIAALVISIPAFSQTTNDLFDIDPKDQEYFVHNIKSIQMFLDRFNFSRDLLGKEIDSHPADPKAREFFVQDRLVSILSAFDYNWVKSASAEEQQLIREFVKKVNDPNNPVFLEFNDPDWYAELTYDATSGGEKIDLTVVAYNFVGGNGGSAWTIRSVKSQALPLLSSTDKLNIVLPPNSDGTDFINLRQDLSNDQELKKLIAQGTSLSPFFELLLQKKITLNHIRDIRYHLLQVENYILTVEEFRREKNNSGWLISKIQKATGQTKIQYRKNILHISN